MVLLVSPRIDVYELSPGGAALPKTDWSEAARRHAQTAIERVFDRSRRVVVGYVPPADQERQRRHAELINIHALVRAAIIMHRYGDGFDLPSKQGRFEWTLGPGASILREDRPAATCALFVELTERRLSRHFVRVGNLGDDFTASASIVDLGSGAVLWFNHRRDGGLGSQAEVLDTVTRLLHDLPF
jgi:hypothetical protein